MEQNFNESKMKLTKKEIVSEYRNAILAIEHKDTTINDLNGEIKELNKKIAALPSGDVIKENDNLKKTMNEVAFKYQELLKSYENILNIYENHLKVLQTVNDGQVNVFYMIKDEANKKYGKKSD
ncbi:MAG: hypothetical protein AB7E61_07240 [Acholeplasmataceae bacterium]